MSSPFVKKLQKDLKKSPGKATVLALLLVVAIWFWSPLVMNLFGGSAASLPPASDPTANSSTSVSAIAPRTENVPPRFDWKQIAQAIDGDPRMKSSSPAAWMRDPFRKLEPKKQETAKTRTVEPPTVVLDISPADAGLVLNSTIVGPARHVARVNGKTYHEGDAITVSVGNRVIDYKLMSVGEKSVVLTLGNREYELIMARTRTRSSATAHVNVPSDNPDFDASVLE